MFELRDLQGVDDAWDVTQNGEEDIDQQVGITPSLEENTEWGQYDCQDDLADVAMFIGDQSTS